MPHKKTSLLHSVCCLTTVIQLLSLMQPSRVGVDRVFNHKPQLTLGSGSALFRHYWKFYNRYPPPLFTSPPFSTKLVWSKWVAFTKRRHILVHKAGLLHCTEHAQNWSDVQRYCLCAKLRGNRFTF